MPPDPRSSPTPPPSPAPLRVGIVTVSDRASRGEYKDRGGPAVRDYLGRVVASNWEPVVRLVPDERARIEAALIELADRERCALVITTGGTGAAERDVTPEATAAVCSKLLPGLPERMRAVSMEMVPTAMLSRQVAGIRGATLIVNLPGSPRAIDECLGAILPALPHCLAQIGAPPMTLRAGAVRAHDPGH